MQVYNIVYPISLYINKLQAFIFLRIPLCLTGQSPGEYPSG